VKALGALMGVLMAPLAAVAGPSLELVATFPLDGVKGRIDHLAVDTRTHRLFVAALGNDTVEVVDTTSGQRKTLRGMGEPQGVAFVADSNRLFVANGSANRLDMLDAGSLAARAKVDGLADADNVRYDAASKKLFVGHGSGALRIVDAASGRSEGDIPLPAHPESFQLETAGNRVFVNVPRADAVVVVDRATRQRVATWRVPGAAANFPMALDEKGRRLFVGARMPATLLVYDIDSGGVVAHVPIGGDTDDVFFDAERNRVYVVCGEGRVDVVRREDADRYRVEESLATAPRARTGLFVAEEKRLYVAAPAAGPTSARILVYAVR